MKKLVVIFFAAVLLTGCASIVSGTRQNVKISAEPAKAEIVITAETGEEFYKGPPTEIELPRKNSYVVEIRMAGYAPQKVIISKGFNGWVIGNLCCGGIIGGIVDLVTGAFFSLEPDSIHIALKTALLETDKGPMIVFFAYDENGELRSLTVPMIKS